MKKLIALAAAVLLVGAGCANAPGVTPSGTVPAQPVSQTGTPTQPAVPGKKPPVPVPNPGGISPTNSEDRVVTFDGQNFNPKMVAVHVGHTVTWINQSNQNMWPASDPHPYHTDCPGFDAKQPVGPGQSYSFTFTVAKDCPYHNHLQTGTTGVVTVTPVGK